VEYPEAKERVTAETFRELNKPICVPLAIKVISQRTAE
jgi:hypothetical protein